MQIIKNEGEKKNVNDIAMANQKHCPNHGTLSEPETLGSPIPNPPLKLVQGQVKSTYGVLCKVFWCNLFSFSKQNVQNTKTTPSDLTTDSS